MNPIVVFVMVGQIVIFLAWSFVAFRTLVRLNNVATERRISEGLGPVGTSKTLGTFGDFLRGNILPHDRMLLVVLTLTMFASIAVRGALS